MPVWLSGDRIIPRDREVYFIRAKALGLIKIGVADYSRTRLIGLQAGCPDELELLGVLICHERGKLEKRLHAQFAHLRVRGEWFRPEPDLMALIATSKWPEPRARRPRVKYNEWDEVLPGYVRPADLP